jgi:hypothetical protein
MTSARHQCAYWTAMPWPLAVASLIVASIRVEAYAASPRKPARVSAP